MCIRDSSTTSAYVGRVHRYRVVVVAFGGVLGSFRRRGSSPDDASAVAADSARLLDDGAARAHVLGYSFAGTLAELALLERPDRFATLTLLSAPPEPGQAFRGVKRIGPISGLTSPRQGAALMLWGIRNNLNRVPPRRLAFVRERFALTRRESVDDIIGLMMRTPDLLAELAASPVPKLVAVGEHDLWPRELHHGFARQIGARFAVYPTGHSPCETAPHQLVRDMLALFDATGATP